MYSLLPPEPTSLTIQAFSKKKEDEPSRGVLSRFIAGKGTKPDVEEKKYFTLQGRNEKASFLNFLQAGVTNYI